MLADDGAPSLVDRSLGALGTEGISADDGEPAAVVSQRADDIPTSGVDYSFPPLPPPFVCEEDTAQVPDREDAGAKKECAEVSCDERSIACMGGWVAEKFLEVVPLRSSFTGKGASTDIFPLPTSFDFFGTLWPSRSRDQIDWMVCVTRALNSFWGGDIPGKSEASEIQIKAGAPLYFHGYRRGRELGRGASGQVFLCHKKGTEGGGFAVKAVDLRRLHLQPNAEREEKKLSREVEILKRLPPHPNIVQLIDTFEEGDWFLLVLELVGGGDLYTVLTTREPPRLQEREASFVLSQLAEGLSFLHSQGIIHRDMKLENVLVANERRERPLVFYTVKITDFGLSKARFRAANARAPALRAIGAGFSEARSTVGTRPYTAPEVLREDSHDFSSDLWCALAKPLQMR
ncbi:Calcium-dependent protein kinase 7 (Calmodulin-domain protein kinase CDPK isoform 7) [Durusdinium trenchii]|uniref:Calcium-dependent protein kinase 7 (Calmodulin-domain protein kinase CDPK isoform 7) n=1 Tax=Durusdinium trenchii TaxID=1381693 RepID=A0ABP0H4L0_9DINO